MDTHNYIMPISYQECLLKYFGVSCKKQDTLIIQYQGVYHGNHLH